jgi:hypothetical protein
MRQMKRRVPLFVFVTMTFEQGQARTGDIILGNTTNNHGHLSEVCAYDTTEQAP